MCITWCILTSLSFSELFCHTSFTILFHTCAMWFVHPYPLSCDQYCTSLNQSSCNIDIMKIWKIKECILSFVCLFIKYYWDIVSYSYLGLQCRDPMKNFCERPSNQEKLMLIYLETIYWSHVGFLIGNGKDLFVPKFVK